MRLSRVVTVSSAFVIAVAGVAVISTTNASAAVVGVDTDIHISEVFGDGAGSGAIDSTIPHDFIELTNTGSQDETLTGWSLKDDTDSHIYPIDSGTVIPAGGYVAFNVDDTSHTAGNFGIGKGGDGARLYDGTTLVDQMFFASQPADGSDINRCAITSTATPVYAFVVAPISRGSANTCPTPATALATVKASLKVNEVLADGTGSGTAQQLDAIELYNTGSISEPLAGWWLSDDKSTDKDVLPANTWIAPVGITGASTTKPANYLTYRVGASATSQFLSQDIFLNPTTGANLPGNTDFGIGKGGDNAALVAPDGTDADRLAFGSDNPSITAPATGSTISRCPDGTATWLSGTPASLGSANTCTTGNPADTIVKINEVDLTNNIVELLNTSTTTVATVTGFTLKDAAAQTFTLPTTTIAAGAYAEINFGSTLTPAAGADTLTLADGGTTVDTAAWTTAFTPSLGRCPDGTGAFAQTAAITDGAAGSTAGANNCATGTTTGYNTIRVSEIETNGDPLGDWIELTNTGSSDVNISGLYLADNGGTQGDPTIFPSDPTHSYQIPGTNQNPTDTTTAGNTVLAAHGYKAFFESNSFPFGLGNPDQARIFSPSKALIDSTAWPLHESGATYVRCPGVTANVDFTDTADMASFIDSSVSTPNAANDCTPPIRINEVQASDPTGGPDWVELTNIGAQPIDISGWVLTDDKDTDGDVIPSGTTLNPGQFLSFEPNNENGQFTAVASTPVSKPFGLGASGDEVRLYQSGAWNGTTYSAGDLVDAFVFEDTSTKTGGAVQPQTVLADGVTKAGGPWPVNASDPTSPETYARCSDGISQVVADGTGAWEVTSKPTEGATNQCDGLYTAQPFPDTHNGQAVTTADNVDLGQNMSGLFYVGGDPRTTADDYMWGIQNGSSGLPGENKGDPGALYKLVQDSNGNWGPAPGWESGVPVRYLNNTTGEIDAEGVTSTAGKVYVTSERDNTNSDVSRIAVVEVDPNHIVQQNGDKDGDLNATHDWELGSDLGPNPGKNPLTGIDPNNPGDANLGLEAVAFVPDSALVADGFKDANTGAAYDPSNYPNHVDGGVFFVGLEKTGKLYAYIFNNDNSWTRVGIVNTGFQTIQDLLWDPTQDALWATCDNGCQGRQSIIKIDQNADANQGTFQVQTVYSRPTGAVQNLNNEGFTVAPISECVNGSRSVYWSDDTDDANHWLRTAKVDCTADTTAPVVTATPSPAANANGWNNTSVTVSFTCTDAAGVDTADSSLGDQTLTASGTVTGTCVDNAGLSASASYTAKIDETAPVVTAAPSPAANANGWNNGPVTVTFDCTDADSGVDADASSLGSQTLTASGTATGTCVDQAGNSATASYTAKIDTTAPVITATPSPAANAAGWNNTSVVVTFDCTDADSGVDADASSLGSQTLTASGTVTGTCVDLAGNSATASYTAQIDEVAPSLAPTVPQTITLRQKNVVATPNATDADSGIASSSCGAIDTSSVGLHTVTCTATDVAGNTTSVNVNYVVNYVIKIDAPVANATYNRATSVPVSVELNGAAGGLITNATGAALAKACAVTLSATIKPSGPFCMTFNKTTSRFEYAFPLPATGAGGAATLTVTVAYPGTTATTTASVVIDVKKKVAMVSQLMP